MGKEVKFYAVTEKGRRERNEDSFLAEKIGEYYVFAVADGLGGHVFGDIASKIAIVELKETIKRSSGPPDKLLVKAFKRANEEILLHNRSIGNVDVGMGTTLVTCILDEKDNGVIANVGDSRAYLIDGGMWHTKDHSFVQELIDAGVISEEEAFNHPQKNVVTRVIGLSEDIEVDTYNVSLNGKILLICSDGLHDYVKDEVIREIILNERDLKNACEKLVSEALKAGSRDNITVIVVRLDDTS